MLIDDTRQVNPSPEKTKHLGSITGEKKILTEQL